MNMNKREFWDSSSSERLPLQENMITAAETQLGVKLPPRYIELLRIQNGGYTNGFAFPMKQKTSWAADHVPLFELAGIVVDPPAYTLHNILNTAYLTQEWSLPARQVLLAGDGHWWISLDYREDEIPCVRWIDVGGGEDILIAESFDLFIDGLAPEENFIPEEE